MHLLLVSSVIKFNLVLSTLPTLPIPMQISLCVCESRSVISNSLPPHGLYSHGILQARMLEWVAFLFSRGSSQHMSPSLHPDSLPAEPQGKPKKTGVGSLSLLQLIFLTQESNWGLLHCRWILYQLSYQGSHWEH